ncbi:MAG: hypothetical protein M1814_000324 [Vezdaea aestivalis]|nr:MAG: hypothetical protein M1814_000324 [Vezdaea aestivalis]
MATDLETLLEMGFEQERAKLAVQKTGGLQGALEWLEKNQDKSLEEIKEPEKKDNDEESPELQAGESALSLVCNDCGKNFRSQAQAEFHASKTEHINFAESTEEIAPLTEEEKRVRLQELRERLAAKRLTQSAEVKADQKKSETIRRKATQETQDIKEDLQKKEQIKEAAKKRREKLEDIAHKKRIQVRIKADQEERRIKAAREKAVRDGERAPSPPVTPTELIAPGVVTSKPASAYTEARLRLQTSNGVVTKTLAEATTLFEVAAMLEQENGIKVQSFQVNFPRKTFSAGIDFGQTLREAGFVPSAALIVK